MTTNTPIDTVILAWLGEGPTGLTAPERRAIADAAEVVAQRHRRLPAWLPGTRRVFALVAATVALVLAVSVLLSSGGPTPTPSAVPSLSPTGTTVPSTTAPLAQAHCEPQIPAHEVRWTGRVRTDVAGMPVVCAQSDPADTSFEGIDIRAVWMDGAGQFHLALAGFPPAASTLDPAEMVIEYGFVFETTGDGAPDYVIGINNATPDDYRVWVTDLATNTTEEQVGGPYGYPVEFRHPDERAGVDGSPGMTFTFLGESEPWPSPTTQGLRFYAWASVRSGADVVAWDYAPDYGWSGDSRAGVPNQDVDEPFGLPFPAALWEQAAASETIRTPETIRLPTPGAPGIWAWTDDLAEPATGSDGRIDLANIRFSRGCSAGPLLCVEFTPAIALRKPVPSPYVDWLAYGLDVDADGDGDADLRLGMDNGSLVHRGWFVDLATGEITQGATSEAFTMSVPGVGVTEYPWLPAAGEAFPGRLWLGREETLWQEGVARFRVWSAVVRDGVLVGFDFAPNDGWLAIPPLGQ